MLCAYINKFTFLKSKRIWKVTYNFFLSNTVHVHYLYNDIPDIAAISIAKDIK